MLEVYKPHTNRKAVGVWLCSAAKRSSKRSALVYFKYCVNNLTYRIYSNSSLGDYCFLGHFLTNNFCDFSRISQVDAIYLV